MPTSKTGEILDYQLLKRVLRFSIPYRSKMWLTAIFAILLAFLAPLRPILINYALDNFVLIPNLELLFQITILMIVVLALESIVQFYYIYYAAWIGQHVIQDLRGKIYKHIVSLKLSFFDKTPIGTVVTRTISDIETIAAIFSEGLLIIIAELLKIVAVLTVMIYTDVKLTIVSLASIPLLLIATSWFKRSIKSAFQQVRTQVSVMNAFIQEHIVGMNIVQTKFPKLAFDVFSGHLFTPCACNPSPVVGPVISISQGYVYHFLHQLLHSRAIDISITLVFLIQGNADIRVFTNVAIGVQTGFLGGRKRNKQSRYQC